MSNYSKAMTLDAVDNAVRFNVPVPPDHPFYTEFSDVRGNFDDKEIYRALSISAEDFTFNRIANAGNKALVFLAGLRGAGKTTELKKISAKINRPDAFFCVFCDLQLGLNKEDMEYMDILVFQIERLVEELKSKNVDIDDDIIADLQKWYEERIDEVNTSISREGGFEIKIEGKSPTLPFLPSLMNLLGISAALKGSLTGSKENANKVRAVLRNSFTDFSRKFNFFLARVNKVLRQQNIGQEVLFIIDGFEKVSTKDIRRKILDDEASRLEDIRAYTMFTLPIELFSLQSKLRHFSTVIPFPFVKIVEKDGTRVEMAIARFREFLLKRIDESLFEEPDLIEEAIMFGGGSPRELLRLMEYVYMSAEIGAKKITRSALQRAVKKLSAEYARYLNREEIEQLKLLKANNEKGVPTLYDESWQRLFEDLIVLEYNDGTYKRVHPIVEASAIYQSYVVREL